MAVIDKCTEVKKKKKEEEGGERLQANNKLLQFLLSCYISQSLSCYVNTHSHMLSVDMYCDSRSFMTRQEFTFSQHTTWQFNVLQTDRNKSKKTQKLELHFDVQVDDQYYRVVFQCSTLQLFYFIL